MDKKVLYGSIAGAAAVVVIGGGSAYAFMNTPKNSFLSSYQSFANKGYNVTEMNGTASTGGQTAKFNLTTTIDSKNSKKIELVGGGSFGGYSFNDIEVKTDSKSFYIKGNVMADVLKLTGSLPSSVTDKLDVENDWIEASSYASVKVPNVSKADTEKTQTQMVNWLKGLSDKHFTVKKGVKSMTLNKDDLASAVKAFSKTPLGSQTNSGLKASDYKSLEKTIKNSKDNADITVSLESASKLKVVVESDDVKVTVNSTSSKENKTVSIPNNALSFTDFENKVTKAIEDYYAE